MPNDCTPHHVLARSSTGETAGRRCLNVCSASMFAKYSVSRLCALIRNLPLKPMALGFVFFVLCAPRHRAASVFSQSPASIPR